MNDSPKLSLRTPDLADKNYATLAALFPNVITETVDENGTVIRAIDAEVLAQEINTRVVSGKEERYQFTWADKKKSVVLANAPIAATLRPCREESVDFDNTEHLYIEGDNLDVLKLLRETYLNRVKMIYIDPPYNTGNDFIYEDDFAEETSEFLTRDYQYDGNGNRMVRNLDSNGRFHTDWLNMMYPRLRIARDLLTDDGVIFISIDDNEVAQLRKICDEVFGSSNFVAQLAVLVNPRGRHLDKFIAKTHETVMVYVKSYNANAISGVEKNGRMVEEYNREDSQGKYRLLGLRNRNQSFNPQTRPNLYYPLYVNPKNSQVSTSQSSKYCDEVFPDTPDGIKTCWTWSSGKVDQESHLLMAEKTGDEWRIYRKDYLYDKTGKTSETLVKSLWDDNQYGNDAGRASIKDLFGRAIMDFPKSPALLTRLLQIGTHRDSIVLDFFSGSATTAHAVMQLNADDNGNRKFVMVQLREDCDKESEAANAGYKNICEIGKERIRRAGEKINTANSGKNIDTGFRVLKLDSSNMKDVYYNPAELVSKEGKLEVDLTGLIDNIKSDRTGEDLLFQVMLDLGILLSSKIETREIERTTIFSVADNYLIACFEQVTDEIVTEIAKSKPHYAVFRDSSFASDSTLVNFEQIFRQYSPTTIRRVM